VEETAEGAMNGASAAETARDAAGITFFTMVSAALLTGADIVANFVFEFEFTVRLCTLNLIGCRRRM